MADEEKLEIGLSANPAGLEAGAARGKAAIGSVTKEAKELDAAFRRIKSSIDPAFQAQEKYNKSLSDSKKLLDAGRLSQQEYAAAVKAAQTALETEAAAIERGMTVAKFVAAERKRLKQEEAAATRAAAQQAAASAAQQAAAEAKASREAAQAEKAAKREAKAAAEDAARAAKSAAREKAQAEKAASKEAAQAEKDAKRDAKTAAREAATAAKQYAKEKREAEREAARASKQSAEETKRAARAEKEAAQAARELRASIDPVFAAQQRYNETMATATRLLQQNKISQTEWIAIQRQAKAQMDLNVRSMGRMNSVYVQLGYQAQDVTASLASGISPLVILAQQGGQTAAALAGLGGTVGRVASFFAGPWGAAIIGATLLIGLMTQKTDESRQRTIDARNAEDLRRATLEELTNALQDYNREQREANINTEEAAQRNMEAAQRQIAEVQRRRAAVQAELATAQRELAAIRARPALGETGLAAQTSAASAAEARVARLQAQLRGLDQTLATVNSTVDELNISEAMRTAEATTDGAAAAQRRYFQEVTRLNEVYRRSNRTQEDRLALERGITAAIQERNRAEEAWSNSQRRTQGTTQETARYTAPVNGPITSGFGTRPGTRTTNGNNASTNHPGNDYGVPVGTPVRAPQVGVVEAVGYSPTLGKYVIISHGAGVTTTYGHLSDTTGTNVGDTVQQGQVFARSGETGNVTGPNLHYEVRINGRPVDPSQGIFPINRLEAEQDAIEMVARAREDALSDYLEGLSYQQAQAGNDYQLQLDLQDQKIQALREFYGEESREAVRAQRERVAIERRLQEQILEEQRRGIQQQEALRENAEDTRYQVEGIGTGSREDDINFRAQEGLITERQAAEERRALLDQEYQNQVAHEERMFQLKLQALRDELALANQSPERLAEINRQIEAAQAEHNGRVEVMQAQYTRDVANSQRQMQSIVLRGWRQVAQTITQSLGQAFQGLWTRTMSLRDAFIQVADQMVYRFVDMGLQMLQTWIMTQLGMKAVTISTKAAETGAVVMAQSIQTGAVIAGAATETGVKIAAAEAGITAKAAESAAGAFAATVSIPFIGPVAAPVAAALALATVLGFAALISAKGGYGEVKGDQLIQAHDKEMVLPADIAIPMRKTFQARGSGPMISAAGAAAAGARQDTRSGDINFNYRPTHNNGESANLEQLLHREGATFRKWIRNQVRNNRLNIGDNW